MDTSLFHSLPNSKCLCLQQSILRFIMKGIFLLLTGLTIFCFLHSLECNAAAANDDNDQEENDDENAEENEDSNPKNDWLKLSEKQFNKLISGWKSFKLTDPYGVSSFTDMHKCVSHSMKTGMKKHPDLGLKLDEVIENHGYPSEIHKVTTSDGWILTLHRIPGGRKSPATSGQKIPVYLNHGLGGNGHEWVLQWHDRSLAFLLADKGYDVWIGNIRGTTYSRKHESLKPADKDFWDFSFDEIGRNDVPAVIDKILKENESPNLYYVGHGLGATAFVVCMSEMPEYNEKIKKAFLLGPMLYMQHATNFIKPMKTMTPKEGYKNVLPYMGGHEEDAKEQFKKMKMSKVYKSGCAPALFQCFGCSSMYFSIGGFNAKEMNYTILPVISSLFPDKISTKTLVHYAQLIDTGKFQRFDYGGDELNNDTYNADAVPEYDLTKVSAPTVIFYSETDYLAPAEDVEFSSRQFRRSVIKGLNKIDLDEFSHGDFVTAVHSKQYVYKPLMDLMEK